MNLTLLPVVINVDIPAIRSRVPETARDAVLNAIEAKIRSVPLNIAHLKPLDGNLKGLYKVPFSSGLQPGVNDMRLAVFLDADTDTAVVWSVGFRDAYQSTDFYRRLKDRVVVERSLGTQGATAIGSPRRRRQR